MLLALGPAEFRSERTSGPGSGEISELIKNRSSAQKVLSSQALIN
jgi:hypothetical protein